MDLDPKLAEAIVRAAYRRPVGAPSIIRKVAENARARRLKAQQASASQAKAAKPPVLPVDSKGRPYQTQETLDQDAAYQANRPDIAKRKVW